MKISVRQIAAGTAVVSALVLAQVFLPGIISKPGQNVNLSTSAHQTRDTISIGFYNVENLFDLNYDGREYPEYRPGALGWNQQTFDKKTANISSVIAALATDIIGLCEIENRNALEALRASLEKRGTNYPWSAMADISGRSTTCPSLLSKYPVVHSRTINAPDGAGAAGRGILEADVDCGACTLKVFVNHWPSKAHPESQRLAMAVALNARLVTLPKRCDYVIIGDLNTDYDEWSKVHSSGLDDTKGTVGLNHRLKTIRVGPEVFLSYVTKGEMCRGNNPGVHFNPWLDIPETTRFTRKYRTVLETPDHILLPASLFDRTGLSYCDTTFAPFTWNDTLLRDGAPYRWQMKGFGKRKFHVGEGYSDHLPLQIRLVKKPWVCDSTSAPRSSEKGATENSGFELSTEGWTGCSREIEVGRDTTAPFSGRWCIRLKGVAGKNNICAGRTVLHRTGTDLSRSVKITFAIRGRGNLSVRIRSRASARETERAESRAGARGRTSARSWQYYKGETFALSGSSRFLPVAFRSWKQAALTYTAESTGMRDVEIEFRAGKDAPFCFYLDNVQIR